MMLYSGIAQISHPSFASFRYLFCHTLVSSARQIPFNPAFSFPSCLMIVVMYPNSLRNPSIDPLNFRLRIPRLSSPSLVIPKILLLVEQIGPRGAQIYNLRTPVAVLLEARTFEAVEGVGDALATAHDALVLVVAEGALVADAGQGGGAHVGVTDGALAVAFVAESANGDASLLAAHDEIAAVLLVCGLGRVHGKRLTDDGETYCWEVISCQYENSCLPRESTDIVYDWYVVGVGVLLRATSMDLINPHQKVVLVSPGSGSFDRDRDRDLDP
jgi:hypothetical protein